MKGKDLVIELDAPASMEVEFPKLKRDSYYFFGEINEESVKDFLYFTNGSDGPMDFYIESPGGYVSSYEILLHCLNKQEDVIIYPVGEVCSCAFFLLLNVNHHVELVDEGLQCVVHFPRTPMQLDYNQQIVNGNAESFKKYKEDSKFYKLSQQLKNLNLDKKKMKKLLSGQDIVLHNEDLKELLDGKLINS